MEPKKLSRRNLIGAGIVSGVGGGSTIVRLRELSLEEMTAVPSTIKARPSTLTTAQLRALKPHETGGNGLSSSKYALIQIRNHLYRLTYAQELGRTKLTVIW